MSIRRTWLAYLLLAGLPCLTQVSLAQPAPGPRVAPASSSASASVSASASASAAPLGSASASASAARVNVTAEIMVLHASNTGGGIDPKIRDLPQLKKPPFSSYNTYRVLSESKVSLGGGKLVDAPLPNGGTVKLALREAIGANRFKLAMTILQPNGQTFLPLLEVTIPHNDPFFVGAQSYREGKLVLAIKLVK
jgi:hypothetical protein